MRTLEKYGVALLLVFGLIALVVAPGASCSMGRGGCSVQLGDGVVNRGGR